VKNKLKPQRTFTGIDGLDEMLGGGIPKGRILLICGGPGTGKTTIAMQYLINGVYKYSEKGLYISFDESMHQIFEEASYFGWEFYSMEVCILSLRLQVPVR
jgi:circadian clock protein KaiC